MEMITIATHLNEKGQAHVESEIEALGLGWDVSATCSEIEEQPDFEPTGCSYEVSAGVFIEIDESMIVTEEIEA